jgi:hypothetical protein
VLELEGGHGLGSCLFVPLALLPRGDECHDIDLDPVDQCPSPYPCKLLGSIFVVVINKSLGVFNKLIDGPNADDQARR